MSIRHYPLKILPEAVFPAPGLPPAIQAVGLHVVCAPVAWWLASAWPDLPAWPWLEAVCAVFGGAALGLALWWGVINAIFVPGLVVALSLDIAPAWALGAFTVMALVYWSVARTQVPLFLSSDAAISALLQRLPATPPPRFLDLGCGTGRVIARLTEHRRDGYFDGIECAPLPWLVARLRAIGAGAHGSVWQGDFWRRNLGQYDVVYAYLSPVPMPRLWQKARHEMRPGTLLISNTFAVPGVAADEIIDPGSAWGGCLYVYRM